MTELFSNPLFGIALSIATYAIGMFLFRITRHPLVNPLAIAMFLSGAFLVVFDIPLSSYDEGGTIIAMFLGPATAVLAMAIYRQRAIVAENLLPILLGTFTGSIASMGTIALMSRWLGLDEVVLASMLPKSVTTPIALAVSQQLGGVQALTIAMVIITGISGNIFAPVLVKLFRVKDPVAQGVAIGSCSHAVGTSKALEMGKVQGAMSSIAISFSGLCTVLLAPLFL
ncbi:putative effector of murein hydrolase [Sphaerochaeta pleomorpha str. Grapes]|uniref:Putative effector of murein hydrolase n=1 Tax=Sphaerochaeta pleomorpha (strain ATCC BAA-1885 / DSM 22778 / Grapes) TaxID=158190 RepID=G8QU60_SPHPG|nr:LrgB family protein [Sphaerochaeta pleomorpha]AEV30307.1 putative effector of murein hydrolase [Sphaerochaeta pleomorpha str. Grapes]